MIKIDDSYSIVENGYGFTLRKYNGKKMTYNVGYFLDLEHALKEYVRQMAAEAVGGEETESDLKTVAEAIKKANKTIEDISR